MTEDEARGWVTTRATTGQLETLSRYVTLLKDEALKQNLIARSTISTIWARHIADCAQLVDFAPPGATRWVDIGSGAGLPGLIVAILSQSHVTLIEPRRLRADFLAEMATRLGLDGRVDVRPCKAKSVTDIRAEVITARAVAPIQAILREARGFSDVGTVWLLPKGASAQSEVAAARMSWQGVFHVEQSIVDPASGIIVAHSVAPR